MQYKSVRIAILLGAPLTKQNFERIGIPYLAPYFEIFVFDCLEWLGRNSATNTYKKAHWAKTKVIRSANDLEEALRKYKPVFAIDFIGINPNTRFIQETLVNLGIQFVVPRTGNLPQPGLAKRIWRFLKTPPASNQESAQKLLRNTRLDPNKVGALGTFLFFFDQFYNRILRIVKLRNRFLRPDISLLAGRKSLDRFTRKSRVILWIGSNDYHLFNRAKCEYIQDRRLQKGPFILFIDEYLPSANDWAILNLRPPVTEATYYPLLCSFFDLVEQRYGLPVIIAAHPNASSAKAYKKNMGGRSIVYGKTAALALECSIVLLHGSTAVSFAVLARKPTVFLTSQELKKSSYGAHVRSMAKTLGSPLKYMDNIDGVFFTTNWFSINTNRYSTYRTNFLKDNSSQEIRPWQTFIDYVRNKSGPENLA
jgi:hypothetical protein